MNYIDIWVMEEFNGDYIRAMQHCLEMAEMTRDPQWIPYIEDIGARLEEQHGPSEDDGKGSARMLGIVMLGTVAFWSLVVYYVFIA